jgi:anti-anti-sigma regulatory factor
MQNSSFNICETAGVVELSAVGELVGFRTNEFRSTILQLLEYGRLKTYRLNLTQVSAMDAISVQLIVLLKRELCAMKTELTIQVPEAPALRLMLERTGVL